MISTQNVILAEHARDLVDLADTETAFRFYIPDLQINKRMRSPLRKDNDPSFTVFVNSSGKLMYHDFTTGESGDIIKFVMQLTGLSYWDAIKKIARDLSLKGSEAIKPTNVARPIRVQKKQIKVIPRKWTERDLMYWEQYGIRLPNLRKYNVYALDSVFLDDILVSEHKSSQPVYGYYLGDGWKIYKPFSTQRFYTSTNTLQGYAQLPASGELLVITKSMKDVILLDSLGYPAVAPHGERVKVINEIEELKRRFENIVILFDNDAPGVEGAEILSEIYSIPYVYIPLEEKVKDVSDYYRINKHVKCEQLLKNLLCQKQKVLKPVL